MDKQNTDDTVYFHEIIVALSYALDLTEGQPKGHCLRSCWIGMHIGAFCGLSKQQLHDLFYTLILKDSGCSSNAARMCLLWGSDDRVVKRNVKTVDLQSKRHMAKFVLSHTGLSGSVLQKYKNIFFLAVKGEEITKEIIGARCDRGSKIALSMGLSEEVASGIYSLDEHYNGKGYTGGLAEESIPLYSRIALLSQVVDVFLISGGKDECISTIKSRSGSWFDPSLVKHFLEIAEDPKFWLPLKLENNNLELDVISLLPIQTQRKLDENLIDQVAEVFGQIIDAKSAFTSGHSRRVADYCATLARLLNLSPDRQKLTYQAGFLHDLGKLGISNTILDSPNDLSVTERAEILKHPQYTEEILLKFLPFHELAPIAGAHHERIDGKGYYKGLKGKDIALETRIITIADIFDALTTDRPYRRAMSTNDALNIMNNMRSCALDNDGMDALHSMISNNSKFN